MFVKMYDYQYVVVIVCAKFRLSRFVLYKIYT